MSALIPRTRRPSRLDESRARQSLALRGLCLKAPSHTTQRRWNSPRGPFPVSIGMMSNYALRLDPLGACSGGVPLRLSESVGNFTYNQQLKRNVQTSAWPEQCSHGDCVSARRQCDERKDEIEVTLVMVAAFPVPTAQPDGSWETASGNQSLQTSGKSRARHAPPCLKL